MSITVHKLNHKGEEQYAYIGEAIETSATHVCIRAIFRAETRDLGYVVLKKGDVFTEWFYTDRWYNVFKVEDADSGELKGYYCNITRPAIITEADIKADDLELDVFVGVNGRWLLLDEEEYDALDLSKSEREHIRKAVEEIQQKVTSRSHPFHDLPK